MGRNVYLCTMNNATHVQKCFVLLFEVWMEKKYVFYPHPFPILAIHSHLPQYMLRTPYRKENIVAHKMLVVFFQKGVRCWEAAFA